MTLITCSPPGIFTTMFAICSLSTHLVNICIPDLGLLVDQWLQLYDLRDHELFLEEIAFNGGEKGSEAITARTSSRANWNTSTTLDRNLSKPASVADPHSANQVPAIAREEIKVFALTRRSEFVASSINRDDGKTAECFVF